MASVESDIIKWAFRIMSLIILVAILLMGKCLFAQEVIKCPNCRSEITCVIDSNRTIVSAKVDWREYMAYRKLSAISARRVDLELEMREILLKNRQEFLRQLIKDEIFLLFVEIKQEKMKVIKELK